MDWSTIPPLNALKAFTALADTRSFTAAGAQLGVTHAAVSQQVRSLEAHLGMSLAQRDGKGVRLTSEGERLAGDLSLGFASILNGIQSLRDDDHKRPVQVTMSPAFAVNWLLPRLPDFQVRHPDLALLLNPTAQIVEFTAGGLDIAIRYVETGVPKDRVDVLFNVDLLIVATPELLGGRTSLAPEELLDLPWLQELGSPDVDRWFERHEVEVDRPLLISHMPGNLIMQAVLRGDGVTFTPRPLVQADIDAGVLTELFCEPRFGTFHIVTRPGHLRPPVREFVAWLRRQAAADPSATKAIAEG